MSVLDCDQSAHERGADDVLDFGTFDSLFKDQTRNVEYAYKAVLSTPEMYPHDANSQYLTQLL